MGTPLQAELNQGREEPEVDLELRFSLDDVKASLREVQDRLEDIRGGEVRYRQSGESLLSWRP